mmetsp:Transcript_3757/g.6989  ORF Transcript_3757/g.6989 Transcript_3757/m.6989 type:complete len:216 (-) Transcript_3757:397-1044(-)
MIRAFNPLVKSACRFSASNSIFRTLSQVSCGVQDVQRPFSSTSGGESSSYQPSFNTVAFFQQKKKNLEQGIRNPTKHKIPRKRASKLFAEINADAVDMDKAANPDVFGVNFRAGDAIECEFISHGGVNSQADIEITRGVVLGRVNRGRGSSFTIRDVEDGVPIERQIPLHSPMLKSIKVLAPAFIHRGKKRVRRSKLYYLRKKPVNLCRVTGVGV